MPTIAWSDDFAIDGSQIDFQHRQLIDAVGDLEDALAAGDQRQVASAVPFLRQYALTHFADEERVLQLIAWPKLGDHREQHRGFTLRLGELEGACSRGDLKAGAMLLGFLASWLAGHIRRVDREFADEVKKLRQRT